MLPLLDVLRLPTTRVLLTTETFVSRVLPPVVCYFATAFLVLLPRTQPVRIALWPITAILALRAATSLDMSMGQQKLALLNMQLQISMMYIAARTLEWTVQTKPFVRMAGRSSTDAPKQNLVLDAIDLVCNARGCGWDWSQGLYIPPETHPTSSRLAFATSALVSGLKHIFLSGAIHSVVKSFSPDTFGSVGGTIFDDSLPPHLRYLRSSIIATLCAFISYSLIKANYEITVVICVLIFRQHPDQCPPLIDSPWRATSLREFWSRRWHQGFRRIFIFLGGKPLSLLFGRIGGVIGTFLASGFIHHFALLPIDPSSEMWRMVLPFGMMGIGMVIERAVSGNKTRGWMGWVWTMCWVLLWGNVMVDGWARAGMFGGPSVLDSATPIRQPIEWLVTFDWLVSLPHEHKIVIAGNHNTYLQTVEGRSWVHTWRERGIIYLEDEAHTIQVRGRAFKIFGSPFTPQHGIGAFQYPRMGVTGTPSRWSVTPNDTDILITHGPPHGHLDLSRLGCRALLARIRELCRTHSPVLHVFGHIHGGRGIEHMPWNSAQSIWEDIVLKKGG
ncbi:uncharacterized protein F5147DRAFT_782105 [Suillus discolor]|uniref:Wax synthase domain-containing protein n=1 Tax=Suillus discolor TaxID=1912936 RepID=A0A9P7ES20_9AGAM|nr:uncharacterized protein F5147DRAFT_782105 [Suillus discolor]KAG2085290.1 hypothetical protein F5147DRAFT_782105 [Suillus discolor]